MEDFFEGLETRTHPWPAGRRDLHWHALFDEHTVQDQLTGPYRGLTHRRGIAPVDPAWIHMTVLHAGPEKDATTSEISQIIDLARERAREIPPFSVTFARPCIGTIAIECQGRPGAPARALWEMTWAVTRQIVGDRWPLIPATYNPHITLGYATADANQVDRQTLKAVLSDIPHGEVTLPVRDLHLVSQSHDGHRIVWKPIATVPLGTP